MKAFNFTEGRIKGLQPHAKGEATYRDTAVPAWSFAFSPAARGHIACATASAGAARRSGA